MKEERFHTPLFMAVPQACLRYAMGITMKIINEKEGILDDVLQGIMFTQQGTYIRMENEFSYMLHRKDIKNQKVQVILNGGAGKGPLFEGFVGKGLADAMVIGEFDCAPNAYALYEIGKKIERGKGILFLANNYSGDYLNNDMAMELLSAEGIRSGLILASDDMFSAKGERKENRGGLSGIGMLTKIASEAAGNGLSLKELYRVTQEANCRMRSMAVCVSEETNKIQIGAGFSGEAPSIAEDFISADQLAETVIECGMEELKAYENSKIFFTVNRMREMTYVEGYVVLMSMKRALEKRGYAIGGAAAGCYYDAYDSNGCIVTVLAANAEIERYIKTVNGYDFTI